MAYADRDDGQRFGLPEIINDQNRASELLRKKQIIGTRIDPFTSDPRIWFKDEMRIDLFSHSSGYEGWNAHFVNDSQTVLIIALAGGQITIFKSSSWNPLLASGSRGAE